MAYGDFKHLRTSTTSDIALLRYKAFNIANNSKYDGCQCGLVSVVYKSFDKDSSSGVITRANKSAIKTEIMPNQHPSNLARIAKISDRTQQLAGEYSFLKKVFGC